MTDKKSSRRKLLKSIAAGSGAVVAGKSLPKEWSKPIVNAVMLPAHAATTDDSGTDPAPTTTPASCGPFCGTLGDGEFLELMISGTTVNFRMCTNSQGLQETTGSGQLNGGSFNMKISSTGGWLRGDINSDCSGATAQVCVDEGGLLCNDVFALSPGTCGVCGG